LLYAETVQADLNSDGIQDLKATFNSDELASTELDRNSDGAPDVWMFFTPQGNPYDTRADYDENYDGRVDEVFFIQGDYPVRSLADRDQDGLFEEETLYREGQSSGKKILNPPLDIKNL
jgi:hypothetical protein